MDLQLPRPAPPDGKLAYRRDGFGRPKALLPARPKLGLHTLASFECRAVVHDGEVHINCPACAAAELLTAGG
ncbi:hypothetical protein [Actinokineospora alba]|uniref:hypothetical protein n=1 Tax=Actinokineospora alba TaxID=504798 RepID=UPI00115FC7E7|nr:hypothetical protein [Actinokineospora alba]